MRIKFVFLPLIILLLVNFISEKALAEIKINQQDFNVEVNNPNGGVYVPDHPNLGENSSYINDLLKKIASMEELAKNNEKLISKYEVKYRLSSPRSNNSSISGDFCNRINRRNLDNLYRIEDCFSKVLDTQESIISKYEKYIANLKRQQ